MLVALHRRRAGMRVVELGQGFVIGGAVAHRLLEDRRVGGDAGQAVLVDQLLQAAFGEELAVDEVEPDGLAQCGEIVEDGP